MGHPMEPLVTPASVVGIKCRCSYMHGNHSKDENQQDLENNDSCIPCRAVQWNTYSTY